MNLPGKSVGIFHNRLLLRAMPHPMRSSSVPITLSTFLIGRHFRKTGGLVTRNYL
jgi:hypothetical protein